MKLVIIIYHPARQQRGFNRHRGNSSMNEKYLIIFLSCFVFSTLNSAPLRYVFGLSWPQNLTCCKLQLKASPESGSAEQSNNNNGKYLHRSIPPVAGHSKVKSGENKSVLLIILLRCLFVLLRQHGVTSQERRGEEGKTNFKKIKRPELSCCKISCWLSMN